MKRIVFAVILSFVFSGGFAAESRKMKIATDIWPPYEFQVGVPGNESMSGFSTEVILAVFKQMNIAIDGKISPYPWARAEAMIIDGSVDVLYTAAPSDKRALVTLYPSESLMESSWSFFIRKEDTARLKFDSLNDLKGKKVGVVRAYAYTPELWAFLEAEKNYEDVIKDDQNVNKLVANRVDYIAMDYGNGLALLKSMGLLDKVVALKNPIKPISLYAIFSKKTVDKAVVDEFSEKLKAFKKTKEYQVIFDKYFGK
jgi:polar amino acid transport system substrate-binding protein